MERFSLTYSQLKNQYRILEQRYKNGDEDTLSPRYALREWVERERLEYYLHQLGIDNTLLELRLAIARELIAALTNNGQLSPRLMTPETKTLWERWQAEEMTK